MNLPKTLNIPITRATNGSWPEELAGQVEVTTDLWSEEFTLAVLCHGLKQLINDSVADPKKYPTPEDVYDRCAEKADQLSTMDHTFGGGGGERLTIKQKVLREVITSDARKRFSMKAADAAKIAMTPNEYFRKVATAASSTPEAVEAAFQDLIAPIVEAKKASSSLNLKF